MLAVTKQQIVAVCKAMVQSFWNFDGECPAIVVVFATFDHKRRVISRQMLSFLRCSETFDVDFLRLRYT
ncbi:hypothetical protein HXT54_01420 [Gardnerella sp. KA00603]|uniref:hypothetical protein n=1 Tax=Gardnerella TaxID=2701 RepID=UPI0012BA8308|nr:hypothetical protein [Gardnerella vaginalis]